MTKSTRTADKISHMPAFRFFRYGSGEIHGGFILLSINRRNFDISYDIIRVDNSKVSTLVT